MQLGKDAIQALPSAVWWLLGPIAWRQETQLISASSETPIDATHRLGAVAVEAYERIRNGGFGPEDLKFLNAVFDAAWQEIAS